MNLTPQKTYTCEVTMNVGGNSWKRELQQAVFFQDIQKLEAILARPEVKLGLSSARWRWRTNEAPLHLAALSGRTEALRRLLDAGADVNASASAVPQVEGAETPLHAAVKAGRADIVLMLMRAGADPIRKGLEAGDSPLECARRLGMTDIVKIMEADAIQARGHSTGNTRPAYSQAPHRDLTSDGTFLSSKISGRLAKEKELHDALMVQEEISECEVKIRKTDEDLIATLCKWRARDEANRSECAASVKALEDQIKEIRHKEREFAESVRKSLESERTRAETKRVELREEIRGLRRRPEFRSPSEISMLTEEVEQIGSLAAALDGVKREDFQEDKVERDVEDHDDNSRSCQVCMEKPRSGVFSCDSCDNWVCGECVKQLAKCPSCRQNFFDQPPRRNRAVERLLDAM